MPGSQQIVGRQGAEDRFARTTSTARRPRSIDSIHLEILPNPARVRRCRGDAIIEHSIVITAEICCDIGGSIRQPAALNRDLLDNPGLRPHHGVWSTTTATLCGWDATKPRQDQPSLGSAPTRSGVSNLIRVCLRNS